MNLPQHMPAMIVGAGPIGLACTISARRRGIEARVIDAGALANSIVRYPVGMVFFTTPERLEIGGHPLTCSGAKATREEALMYYRGVARAEGLAVQLWGRLVAAERRDDVLHYQFGTRLGPTEITCDRLVLATGYFDHPNALNVPGKDLPHVTHWFDEPHLTIGQDVVIIGGKNSAIATALQCFRAGANVTLVYRQPELKPSVKFRLKPDFENRVKAGEITAYLGSEVIAITPAEVEIREPSGATRRVPADRVYALTGYHPDFALLETLGVQQDGEDARPRLNPETLEANVPGVFLAGSVTTRRNTSEVFIENGRFDGEKIFGDAPSRTRADEWYASHPRPVGE